MEVLLKSDTTICKSPRKIDTSKLHPQEAKIDLQELATMAVFEKVTVNIKAVRKLEPVKISNEFTKQDIVIADATATTKVAIRGEKIDKNSIKKGDCYCLQNFVVKEWNSVKYLSMPRSGLLITPIFEIGEVKTSDEMECPPDEQIEDADVIGVPQLHAYKCCLTCRARVEPMTPPMGKCTKDNCAMIQRYDLCSDQGSAKVLLRSGSRRQTLKVFGKLLHELAGVPESQLVTTAYLLKLPPIPMIKFNGGVITEICKDK